MVKNFLKSVLNKLTPQTTKNNIRDKKERENLKITYDTIRRLNSNSIQNREIRVEIIDLIRRNKIIFSYVARGKKGIREVSSYLEILIVYLEKDPNNFFSTVNDFLEEYKNIF